MQETIAEDFDLFLYGNRMSFDGKPEEYFVVNNNGMPYRAIIADNSVRHYFMVNTFSSISNVIQIAGASGARVAHISDYDGSDNTIVYEDLEKCQTPMEVVEQLYSPESIEDFSYPDNIRFIVTKVSCGNYADGFIFKSVKNSSSVFGGVDISSNGVMTTRGETRAFVINELPEVLVIGGKVFIFNLAAYKRMFGEDIARRSIIDQKIEELMRVNPVSLPDGMNFREMVLGNTNLQNLLMKADIGRFTNEQVAEQGENYGVDVMTDTDLKIIIMDTRDAAIMLNILCDNYVNSEMSAQRYRVNTKTLLQDTNENQTRIGVM